MNNDHLKAHAAQRATEYLALLYDQRDEPAVAIGLELRALQISDNSLRTDYLIAFLDALAARLDGDDPFVVAGKVADQPSERAEAQVYFRAGKHIGHLASVHSHRLADRQTATLTVYCACGTKSSDLDAKHKDRQLIRLTRSARHLAPPR